MIRNRIFLCAVLALIVAFCAVGQLALAQSTHVQVRAMPRSDQPAKVGPDVAAASLFPLWQAFTSFKIDPNTGVDEWPCPGGGSECPTIDPSGWVLGNPNNIWSLSNCNATSTSTPNCGQTETFYEDNTGDNADDLLYILTATQIQNGVTVYVYDSGTVDFLTNPFAAGSDVIVYGDSNFGTMGLTGKNNGDCFADFNYPSPDFSLGVFVIQANKTCVAPVAGPVTLTATTELATPTWTQKNGQDYTVKFTVTHKITQKWTIYLQ